MATVTGSPVEARLLAALVNVALYFKKERFGPEMIRAHREKG